MRIRQRTWIVDDVEPHDACRLLTLSGHASDGRTASCRVLHPFDDVEQAEPAGRTRRVGARSWSHACASLLMEHADASALRSAATANLEVLPYQLEPALVLVRGEGSRVLIADEVGLGKTVQALICAAELRARGIGSRVLVLCPAGLREQWVDEARARVGLDLTLVDHATLRRLAARLPADVSPWSVEPCVVASIDYAKRPEVLPSVLSAGWDLVIVDEAHGSCGLSDRRAAVSELTRRSPFVILLTATPHSGDEEAFASLCSFGRLDDDFVVFRRSRLEAGRDSGRRAHTRRVRLTAAERRMHAALAALTRAVRRERREMDQQVWLMLSLLHKRAFSSAHALAASAERRLQMLAQGAAAGGAQLLLPLDDDTGELDTADAAPMWHVPALEDVDRERRLLQHVIDAAHLARGSEGKLLRLRRLLHAIKEPVIVFTEYRDTLHHLRTQVAPGAVSIHGGLSRDQRRAAIEAFPAAGVLLATDAAGEGLNLQHHCRTVINLELPWNPMRLEQRIGRVDRIGQKRRVHVFHLIAEGTGEARLLERLSTRVAQARARVGAPNPLVGRREWTEDASAQIVVFRAPESAERDGPMAAPPVPLTRLSDEGRCEAERIALVRALCAGRRSPPDAHRVPHAGTLITRARPRLRMRLGARRLLIFRSTIVDGAGRAVATHVHGLLAPAGTDAADVIDPAVMRWVIDAASDAQQSSLSIHRHATERRLDRARRIAALFADDRGEQQPGLFDRRVERSLRTRDHERLAAAAIAADRIHRIEVVGRTCIGQPELVLIVEPARPGFTR